MGTGAAVAIKRAAARDLRIPLTPRCGRDAHALLLRKYDSGQSWLSWLAAPLGGRSHRRSCFRQIQCGLSAGCNRSSCVCSQQAHGTLPLIAIDHEGGLVHGSEPKQGFTRIPRASLAVAQTLSLDQARSLYAKAGSELAAVGFNLNTCTGGRTCMILLTRPSATFGRAFATDPETVASYAEALIDGFAAANILCAAKHFPGTWSLAQRQPFQPTRYHVDLVGAGA